MKKIVSTASAPKAVGPYSQAVEAGGWVWVSMQLPLDPVSGVMVEGDITLLARRTLLNVEAVLKAAGSSLDQAVKTTLYLADMNDFAEVNKVYAEFFKDNAPCRAALQAVSLPKGARVAIDAVAWKG